MEQNTQIDQHRLQLEGRKECKISGVLDVLSFDVNEVMLETVDGMLSVKGNELHVSRLSLEKGEIDIEGKTDAFIYSEKTNFAKKGESLITRLFS